MANYTPEQMAQKIRSITARGGITAELLTVNTNGTYTAPAGTAYTPVTVAVPQVETETLNATANGTYTPEAGKAYSSVTVAVPVYDGTVT